MQEVRTQEVQAQARLLSSPAHGLAYRGRAASPRARRACWPLRIRRASSRRPSAPGGYAAYFLPLFTRLRRVYVLGSSFAGSCLTLILCGRVSYVRPRVCVTSIHKTLTVDSTDRGLFMSAHLYPTPQHVVALSRGVSGFRRHPRGSESRSNHDPANELPRILLPRTPVNRPPGNASGPPGSIIDVAIAWEMNASWQDRLSKRSTRL